MHYKLLICLLFFISVKAQVKKPDSLQLFFDSAKFELTEDHKTQINDFVKSVETDKVLQIKIKGYTDFVGDHVYNNKLSKKRANSAYKYISTNFEFRAILRQGLGEVESDLDADIEEGIGEHRKVDIIFSYEKPKAVAVSLNRKQKYLSELTQLTVGEKLRLRNINFQISTTVLARVSEDDLEGVTKILKANPRVNVRIEGHVCCGSKEEYESKQATSENLKLSTDRAKAIYDELIKRGIKSNRLSYVGYGFTRPLSYPESNVEIQRENRRIELKVLNN